MISATRSKADGACGVVREISSVKDLLETPDTPKISMYESPVAGIVPLKVRVVSCVFNMLPFEAVIPSETSFTGALSLMLKDCPCVAPNTYRTLPEAVTLPGMVELVDPAGILMRITGVVDGGVVPPLQGMMVSGNTLVPPAELSGTLIHAPLTTLTFIFASCRTAISALNFCAIEFKVSPDWAV